MFWVISTALVLQGVIIAARGPIKKSVSTDFSILCAFANNQLSFEMVSADISSAFDFFFVCTAKTVVLSFPKK